MKKILIIAALTVTCALGAVLFSACSDETARSAAYGQLQAEGNSSLSQNEALTNKDENIGNQQSGQIGGNNTAKPTYISAEEAFNIAVADALAPADAVIRLKTELDVERFNTHYDIEFIYNGFEYEYDIDAVNGAVLDKEIEEDDRHCSGQVQPPIWPDNTQFISKTDAVNSALAHAGLLDAYKIETEFEFEKGRAYYEIEFKSGRYEYEYKINAVDGSVLYFEKEIDD